MDTFVKSNDHEDPTMTGTTILAFQFNHGVIIAADSRTSRGNFVANPVADKLTKITEKIYCCRSGSAAHTQQVADIVRMQLDFISRSTKKEPLVKTAARLFQNLCYRYRNMLVAGIIVGGWDSISGGQVYIIGAYSGMMERLPYALSGSGSAQTQPFFDAQFPPEEMNENDAIEFAKRAVALAMFRDNASGGIVRVRVITKDKVEPRTFTDEVVPTVPFGGPLPAVPTA